METILKLEHLNKSFGNKKIVDDISFEIYAGEIFGFLGPNGAGKTTTIKMILGFLGIDKGDVYINGCNIKKNYEKAMSFAGGIVENPEMYKDLSGLTNLRMYARLHDGVTEQRIQEAVALVGLQNRIHEKVKRYSLGMKQRCGLAQAILHKPKLLILDEPTNGLDPSGIRELRDLLKKLAHEENIAVFVSSHLLSEMQLMCDRVGIINSGKLIGIKPVKELLEGVTGSAVYRFIAKPKEVALQLLSEKYETVIKLVTNDFIDIQTEEEDVPEIVSLLVKGGIQIYGVSRLEASLEEAFLNITGGGNVIA